MAGAEGNTEVLELFSPLLCEMAEAAGRTEMARRLAEAEARRG